MRKHFTLILTLIITISSCKEEKLSCLNNEFKICLYNYRNDTVMGGWNGGVIKDTIAPNSESCVILPVSEWVSFTTAAGTTFSWDVATCEKNVPLF